MTEIKENEKTYELRKLTADDVFPMFQIISKIGIKEFKTCFDAPEVKAALEKMAAGDETANLNSVGLIVALDVASLLMANLPKCKEDIYLLLAQLSGMNKKEIASLDLVTFTDMVIDVIRKEEFADFFQRVSKLFR